MKKNTKKYFAPEIELTVVLASDVITVSGCKEELIELNEHEILFES